MSARLSLLALLLLVVAAAPLYADTANDVRVFVPETGLVLDAGDVEAAALVQERVAEALAEGAEATIQPALAAAAPSETGPAPEAQTAPAPRPKAFEYSDGYRTRLKIHKYASFAMLPLFVAQYAVGQKLYDGTGTDSTRSAHGALAASTAVLFGVNTVTGVWNLSEGRKDPNNRTKRMLHGILMLAADAGFVATGALAPDDEGGGNRSAHRAVALTSMGVATVAYLMMLIH